MLERLKLRRTPIFALVAVACCCCSNATLLFTEFADPDNYKVLGHARYAEMFNTGDVDIDLADGWQLQRYTNSLLDPQDAVDLSGTVPARGYFVVCANANVFLPLYNTTCDQDMGLYGPAHSNGDDQILLLHQGNLTDIFGVIGQDGTGTPHNFQSGRAVRRERVRHRLCLVFPLIVWLTHRLSLRSSGDRPQPGLVPQRVVRRQPARRRGRAAGRSVGLRPAVLGGGRLLPGAGARAGGAAALPRGVEPVGGVQPELHGQHPGRELHPHRDGGGRAECHLRRRGGDADRRRPGPPFAACAQSL